MGIILEAITHVGYGGRIIEPGETFSTDEKYAEKLIKGKSAKVANSIEKKPTRKRGKADDDEKDV